MSVVLDLAGNSMRLPGNVISTLRLMYCSSFARLPRVAAFFTMLFVSIANGEVSAVNDLRRHAQPVSIFIHGSEIHMTSNDRAPMVSPISYFSDRMPDDAGFPSVPDGATGVVVAR